MNFTVTIGGKQVPCRLPLMPTRYRLAAAEQSALGMRFDDDGKAVCGEDGKPAFDTDPDAYATVAVAALGSVWRGSEDLPKIGKFPDVLEYGTEVWAALVRHGYTSNDIVAAGSKAAEAVRSSLPTADEVDEAEGNFEAPAATSTPST